MILMCKYNDRKRQSILAQIQLDEVWNYTIVMMLEDNQNKTNKEGDPDILLKKIRI